MKKLHFIISTLCIIISTNLLATNNDTANIQQQEENDLIFSKTDTINSKKGWLERNDIYNVIDNKYENDQFDVKQQPICIEKLIQIILSFINGNNLKNYIVIGIVEDSHLYRKMTDIEFRNLNPKVDGIYNIVSENNENKYYQVFQEGSKTIKSEIKLNFSQKVTKKDLIESLSLIPDNKIVPASELNHIFKNIKKTVKPIDAHIFTHIKFPLHINIDENNIKKTTKFESQGDYFKKVKEMLEIHTYPKISYESYVEVIDVKPDEENKIIVLEIKRHETELIKYKQQFFGRVPPPLPPEDSNQESTKYDYSSEIMDNVFYEKMKAIKKKNRIIITKYNNKEAASSKLADLFNYIYEENLENAESLLVEHPKLTRMLDSDGNNVLILAVMYERISLVKYLLNKNINSWYNNNNEGKNVFLIALSNKSNEILKLLLEKNPYLFYQQNRNNDNIFLIITCQKNNWEFIKYLLGNYASQNLKNGERNRLTKKDLKEMLVIINKSEEDPEQRKEIRELLESFLKLPYNMFEEATKNNVKKIESLLKKFPYLIKKVDKYGNNVFLIACQNNSWEIIKYLLDNFQPKREKASNKLTQHDLQKGIIIISKLKEDYEFKPTELLDLVKQIRILVNKNIKNRDNFFYAVIDGDIDTFKNLLDKFPDLISAINQDGDNIFLVACKENNWEAIEYILEKNKDLKKIDLEAGLDIINKSEEDPKQYKKIKELIQDRN